MPGPAPKPTQLRIIEGNPGKRPLPTGEPVPPAVPVVKPDWLSEEASEEWDRVAPQLVKMRVLTSVDLMPFAAYCEAVARFKRATRLLEAGALIPSARDDGSWVKNPAAQLAKDATADLKALALEFGMTPSARSRVSLPEGAKDDPDVAGILS